MHGLSQFARTALVTGFAAALPAMVQADSLELVSEAPDAAFFEKEPGRTWLSHCAYQSDRYVVCKNAAPPVLEAIAEPETTAGAALQDHMRGIFEAKGCTFEAPADTFRVNGIFLSFDAGNAKQIRCGDQSSDLKFRPGVISFLDTIYFLNDGPPR